MRRGDEGDPQRHGDDRDADDQHQMSEQVQQRAILDLEKRRFKYQGAKERAIGAQLGMPVTEYYQRLNAMLADPSAWRQDFRVMSTVDGRRRRAQRQRPSQR